MTRAVRHGKGSTEGLADAGVGGCDAPRMQPAPPLPLRWSGLPTVGVFGGGHMKPSGSAESTTESALCALSLARLCHRERRVKTPRGIDWPSGAGGASRCRRARPCRRH